MSHLAEELLEIPVEGVAEEQKSVEYLTEPAATTARRQISRRSKVDADEQATKP